MRVLIPLVAALLCACPGRPPDPPPPADGGAPPDEDGGPPPPPPFDAGPPPPCPELPTGTPDALVFQETARAPLDLDNDAAFGGAVAFAGDRVFVAAPGQGERGAVYVYGVDDLTVPLQILSPSTGDLDEDLASMDAADEVLVIGSDDQAGLAGRAWWFEDTGGGFVERGELVPVPATVARERFGVNAAVSADGQLVVVAASAQRVDGLDTAGAVHVFRRVAGEMLHAQQLTSPEPRIFEQFGLALALDDAGELLLVGAPQLGDGSGQFHTFALVDGAFVHRQTFASPNAQDSDLFGGTLDVDDTRALVGDPRIGGGEAWVLTRCGDQLTGLTQLVGPEVSGGDAFGLSVRLTSSGALIGRFGFLDRFVFDGAWRYVQALEPIDRVTGDGYGTVALELTPDRLVASRPGVTGGELLELNRFE